MERIRCLMPWQQMVVDATTGGVTPCGQWFGNKACGNVHTTSLLEIWNSPVYQRLRSGMFAGDLKLAGCAECFAIKQKSRLRLRFDADVDTETPPSSDYARNLAQLRREIAKGTPVLEAKPTILSMTFTHNCNIRCLHCCQESTRDLPLLRESLYSETMELASVLSQLIIGGGEPFADPHWKRFFAEWQTEKNPYLGIAVTTNGTIVTMPVLDALRKYKTLTLNVSFDGGCREVYEKIRVGAKFDTVIANVTKFRDLARAKAFSHCGWSMSVMKSNILDIPNFLRLSHQMLLLPGFSPVTAMPVHEALTMFNTFRGDTAGWREMFDEVRTLCSDDFLRPLYAANKSSLKAEFFEKGYAPIVNAIEMSIPWHIAALPAHEVHSVLPAGTLHAFAEDVRVKAGKRVGEYRKSPVLVFFPKSENYRICRYYADLDDHNSWSAALPEDTYRIGIVDSMVTPHITHPHFICQVTARKGGKVEAIWRKDQLQRVKRFVPSFIKRIYHRLCDFCQ